jgi:hypothetical protein
MLVVLILGVMAVVAVGVMLLQRNQSRKSHRATYFSHTLGISDPAPAKAEDETPAL